MYHLQFLNQAAPKEPVVINQSSITIGRDAACEVQVSENGVDERHARIDRRGNGYYLCDLDSSNGSFVNGQRVTERRLTSGDEVEIGAARMRFEIMHGVGTRSRRRPLDPLQVAAVTIVVVVIGGQVVLLSSIFSASRPAYRVELSHGWRGDQATVEPSQVAPTAVTPREGSESNPASRPRVSSSSSPAPSVAVSSVLNRMIRIVRVDRRDSGGVATLTIQAKAQVGERELDDHAVAICVQFASGGGSSRGVVWRDPIWLPISAWENFKNKLFTVHYPGAPGEMKGFVVRTYYRGQIQDIAVTPAGLQPPAPNPIPGGAS